MAGTTNKPLETIVGFVERITYHNHENGFAVIKAYIRGRRELVTVTGSVPSITLGEHITASGCWHNDLFHGLQFKAEYLLSVRPTNIIGIEKYLGSGLIRGIGPHFAKKLVDTYKEDVFNVIEQHPKRLKEVEGLGKVRINQIVASWSEQQSIREIMIFLQSHGVSTMKATRIFKVYGQGAINIVNENPYQLSRDIYGIGFLSADKIAMNLGIAQDSILRARAAVNYVLMEAVSLGNCALPQEELVEQSSKLLKIPKEILVSAIDMEVESKSLIKDRLDGIDDEMVFLSLYYHYERNIANILSKLPSSPPVWYGIDGRVAIPWVESRLSIKLADNQIEAISTVLQSKITVITGGPGTGKTTLINSILKILTVKNYSIKLCAPTGRAAKRLSETTGNKAVTIHRLLQFNPSTNKFNFNNENPLKCDLLIVDECSMIDVPIMHSLLRALPATTGLILVGDVDQLPSVGPGQVLKDIINSGAIPTIKLDHIFRQAATSDIIVNAHMVNQGQMPNLKSSSENTDFYFVETKPENIAAKIIELVKSRIPKKFNFDPIMDIQILCPMQKGAAGVRALNIELQKALNPAHSKGIERYGQVFAPGDKVMQIVNNYDKDVYNGDIGFIKELNPEEQTLIINFDNNNVRYEFSELDEIILAYATTIHKSQGSEYPVIIMPISMQHLIMLKKNLIYTGITRGRKLVMIVGEQKALAIAVQSDVKQGRYTKLKEFLKSAYFGFNA